MAGDRCQNSHTLSRRGGGRGGYAMLRQVQPPFHTVGNYYLSVIEGSSVDNNTDWYRTVSSDQVQMDALILTVELAGVSRDSIDRSYRGS